MASSAAAAVAACCGAKATAYGKAAVQQGWIFDVWVLDGDNGRVQEIWIYCTVVGGAACLTSVSRLFAGPPRNGSGTVILPDILSTHLYLIPRSIQFLCKHYSSVDTVLCRKFPCIVLTFSSPLSDRSCLSDVSPSNVSGRPPRAYC